MIEALSRALARVTRLACVAILFVMLALLGAQVVLRYAFGAPPSWTEEVAIILFAWLVLLFASVGVRERFHVAVDWLASAAPSLLKNISDRLVLALTLLLGLALLVSGCHYAVATVGQTTAATQVPIEVLHAAAPVCGLLVVIHALARFLRVGEDGGGE